MTNELVEKFNEALKNMLKRLCAKEPRQWHRFINTVLFAYREVPQESIGFAPFESLYGKTVRGPMKVLQQLWTKEDTANDVKTCYQHVFELRERLDDMMEVALASLKESQKITGTILTRKLSSETSNLAAKCSFFYLRMEINC